MKYTNITDESFWNSKYAIKNHRYYLIDPLYGANGILYKTLHPLINNSRSILELGCGSSKYLMFFKLVCKLQTFGIDFSDEGLIGLQQMAKEHKCSHNLYSGDMFEHNLDGKKFDIVFHAGLVEHFKDLNGFFNRCRFFCKNDGLMIFFIPNMQNKAWSWHKRLCPENYKSHILYTKEQIVNALEQKFSMLSVKSWGYPQLYAGGPPETFFAKVIKYLNLFLMLLISLFFIGYKGEIGEKWASSWFIICKPKG